MGVVEGGEERISYRERQVVLVQLSESRREIVFVAKVLGKAIRLILEIPHKLDH